MGVTARHRRWEQRRPKRPSQIFLAWPRRRAALDRRTPLWGHGKQKKDSKQQSTSGRKHVRAARGLPGGHGSDPLRLRLEFWCGGGAGLPKTAAPLLLGQKRQKTTQATINRRDRTRGINRERTGGHGIDPLHPHFDFGGAVAPGGLRPPHRSSEFKKHERNTQTTINYLRETRGRSRRTVRGVTIEKCDKIDYKALTLIV